MSACKVVFTFVSIGPYTFIACLVIYVIYTLVNIYSYTFSVRIVIYIFIIYKVICACVSVYGYYMCIVTVQSFTYLLLVCIIILFTLVSVHSVCIFVGVHSYIHLIGVYS